MTEINELLKEIEKYKKKLEDEDLLNSLLRHDVTNKIQIAIGYLGLKDEKGIGKAELSLKSAMNTISNIGFILKSEEIKIEPTHIDEIINRSVEEYRSISNQLGIEVAYEPSGYIVKGNSLLKSVFDNLLENSMKHSQGTEIHVYGRKGDDFYIFSVEDNGIGIPNKEILKKGVKGEKSDGTGFGAYAIKTIVEKCGGKIEVVDSENYPTGAQFNIYLQKAL